MDTARCSICGEEHPLATMVTGHRNPQEVPEDAEGSFPRPSDWWLEDAEALNAEHPRSFFIPPAPRRAALRPGELIRLGFVYGPHADREGEGHVERMWVEVLEAGREGYLGRVRNRPFRLTGIEIGDRVTFEPRHVLAIDYSDEELGYPQDQWPVVDRAILQGDRPPDLVVRGPSPLDPDAEEWWMLVSSDPAGPSTEGVGLLTDRFPGLEEPLRAGAGVWELSGGQGPAARWRRVPESEVAASEHWRGLRTWLEETAQALRAS